MNTKIMLMLVLLLGMAIVSVQTQPISLMIKETYSYNVSKETGLTQQYIIDFKKENIPKGDRWYLFVLVEPNITEAWEEAQIEMTLLNKNGESKIKKICRSDEGVDSCFITNRKFQPLNGDKINVKVTFQTNCQYKIVAEVNTAYKLQPDTSLKLDFEDSAYSKVFSLDVSKKNFDEVRIILRPLSFLQFPAPIQLYANKGWMIPSSSNHDFRGLHLWDDGQGIFIQKEQLGEKDVNLYIVVTGPQKNVLQLQATFFKKDQIQTLESYQPLFDYLKGENEERKYNFTLKEKKKNLYIRITTFTGSVMLNKVMNKESNKVIDHKPVTAKHGQIIYKFTTNQIEANKLQKVEISVQSKKQSTFLVEYYSQGQTVSTLRSDLSTYSQLQREQFDQYGKEIIVIQQQKRQHYKFEIKIVNVNGGEPTSKFFQCKEQQFSKCQINKSQLANLNSIKDKYEPLVHIKKNTQSDHVKYFFKIDIKTRFTAAKDGIKKFWLFIVISNEKQQNLEYLIELTNANLITLLKQQQVRKDRLDINQSKIYKFSNMNEDITEVRIHTVEISGKTKFQGSFTDPRVDQNPNYLLPSHRTIIYMNVKKNTTIFLKATAFDYSYYSVSLQIIRTSETEDTKDRKSYNQLMISEGIQYEFLIEPNGKMVFQGHPKNKTFRLILQSNLFLQLCMTQNITLPPFKPNCEITKKLVDYDKQILILQRGDVVNVGVTNYNAKNVTFKIKLISGNQSDDKKPDDKKPDDKKPDDKKPDDKKPDDKKPDDKKPDDGKKQKQCIQGTLGNVNQADSGSKSKTYCVTYNILTMEQLQVSIDFASAFNPKANIQLKINNKENIMMLSPMKKITKEELQKDCGDTKDICKLSVYLSNIQPTRMFILVQHTNKEVRLMDGLAYSFSGPIQISQYKYFTYLISNKINTTVILENKLGFYKFYTNIVNYKEYHLGKNDIFPTKKSHQLVSTNPFYFLHQTVFISEEKVKQNCKEDTCMLLISVMMDEDLKQSYENGKFVIEVTQEVRFLKENTPIIGYLEKKSMAFYEFYNQNQGGTILISVNNENKNCLNIYLKKGINEKASQSTSDKQVRTSNELLYESAEKGTYSITLQAENHCSYTIQATSSKNKVAKITKGIYNDISLMAGKTTRLIFQNTINETFKVISLISSGETMISVKPLQYKQFNSVINSNPDSIQYDWSGKDVVRVENNKKKYCYDCFYLIEIEAIKNTQASIVIPTPNVQIPVSADKIITDQLLKNQQILFRIYTGSIVKSQVYVQYGKIEVTIVTEDKQKFVNVYQPKDLRKTRIYNTQKKQLTYDVMKFSIVTIKALQNSLYTFKVFSSVGSKQPGIVQAGIPQYIYLDAEKEKCIKGYLNDASEELLVSYVLQDHQFQHSFIYTFKINDKIVKLANKTAKNQMLLLLPQKIQLKDTLNNPKANLYEICFKLSTSSTLTFIQSSRVNFLPLDSPIYVNNQVNLTFGSNGANILEINQCQSKAKFSISSQFNTIRALKSQITQYRKKHNIIEFVYYGPVYVHVEAKSATVMRKQKNEVQGIGMGYDFYSVGTLRIQSDQSNVIVIANPIQQISKSKVTSKITKVVYTAYVTKQFNELQNAMNCEKGIFLKQIVNITENFNDKVTFKFNINDLKNNFGGEDYSLVGVIARVKIQTKDNIKETYRMVYHFQEIPKVLIFPYQTSTSFFSILFYFILAIFIVALLLCVYRKFLKRFFVRKEGLNEGISGNEMQYSGFPSS